LWSFSTELPLTPMAPTSTPFSSTIGKPPGKVINPSLECSLERLARLGQLSELAGGHAEEAGCLCLLDGNVDGAHPGVVHAQKGFEIGAGIDHGNTSGLSAMACLRAASMAFSAFSKLTCMVAPYAWLWMFDAAAAPIQTRRAEWFTRKDCRMDAGVKRSRQRVIFGVRCGHRRDCGQR
jgi:hypothetical protein